MAEPKTSHTIQLGQIKKILRTSPKDYLFNLVLTYVTATYGLERSIFFEVECDRLVAKIGKGPGSRKEHESIQQSLTGKPIDYIIEHSSPEQDVTLNSFIKSGFDGNEVYHIEIPLNKSSRLQRVVHDGISYEGNERNRLTLIDMALLKRLTFGGAAPDDYVALTIKGRDKRIIGVVYADNGFSGLSGKIDQKLTSDLRTYVGMALDSIALTEERDEMIHLARMGRDHARIAHSLKSTIDIIIGGWFKSWKDDTEMFRSQALEAILDALPDGCTQERNNLLAYIDSCKTYQEVMGVELPKALAIIRNISHIPQKTRFDAYSTLRSHKVRINENPNFKFDVPDTLAYVIGDESHYGRIIEVLVNNAYEANISSDNPGTVTLSSHVGRNYVHIIVSNQQQIPPHVEMKMFNLGYSTKKGTGGKGIGLFDAKDLAAQNGYILTYATSENGTRFELRIPLAAKQQTI